MDVIILVAEVEIGKGGDMLDDLVCANVLQAERYSGLVSGWRRVECLSLSRV
jgi:hypothetical protein